MKRQCLCMMTTLAMLLTLCLTLPSARAWAEGEDFLTVPVEIKDTSGKLAADVTFSVKLARQSEKFPLPDKNESTLSAGQTDEFNFYRADFDEPGNYTYIMTQGKVTGNDNVVTDETTYNITVRVVNGESGLVPTVEIRKEGQSSKLEAAVFSNSDKNAAPPPSPKPGGSETDGNKTGDDPSDTDVLSNYVIRIFSPGTGEAFPYVPLALLGVAALLGAWGIRRRVKTVSARKDGDEV